MRSPIKANGHVLTLAVWLTLALIMSACGGTPGGRLLGEAVSVGQGTARAFAELNADGSPIRLGVVFDAGMLEGLPTVHNTTNRCFDVNGDGSFALNECVGDYEYILSLPKELAGRSDIPFQWISLNWNPEGHIHPAPPPWAVPHFDFHFYTASRETVEKIRPGTCAEFIDCEDFKTAQKPVPAQYLPAGHIDVGAAVPRMGNHLINPQSPELTDPNQKFTHTFIYGAYDGHIIFYEPMITRDFLLSKPDVCTAVNLPQAWETAGYYPTEYCIQGTGQEYTVSLEKFVKREAQ